MEVEGAKGAEAEAADEGLEAVAMVVCEEVGESVQRNLPPLNNM